MHPPPPPFRPPAPPLSVCSSSSSSTPLPTLDSPRSTDQVDGFIRFPIPLAALVALDPSLLLAYPPVQHGNFLWRLAIQRVPQGAPVPTSPEAPRKFNKKQPSAKDGFGIYLFCEAVEKSAHGPGVFWCDAGIALRIVHARDAARSVRWCNDCCAFYYYSSSSRSGGLGFSQFGDWEKVLDSREGYVFDGKVVVVEARWQFRERHVTRFDRKLEDPLTDRTLVVEGRRKVYVNRGILSIYSGYFSRLFSRHPEVTTHYLPAWVQSEQLTDFLRFFYPDKTPITKNNVTYLLRYSRAFVAPTVLRECSLFLRKTDTMTAARRLALGQEFALPRVVDAALRALSPDDAKELTQRKEFLGYGVQLRAKLMEIGFGQQLLKEWKDRQGNTSLKINILRKSLRKCRKFVKKKLGANK